MTTQAAPDEKYGRQRPADAFAAERNANAARKSIASDSIEDELQQYRRVSLAAMASVGLAIVGVGGYAFTGLLIFPLIGAVCAIVAFVNIRRFDGELTGKGLATFGLVASTVVFSTAVGYHAYEYATEVPENMQRVWFYELEPSEKDPPKQLVSTKALELDGEQVFIKGYIHPSVQGMGAVKRFVLVPDMGTCCFGGQPDITDMVAVELKDALSAKYNMRMRKVGGEFKVNRAIEPVKGLEGLGPGVAFELNATHLK